MLSSVLRIIAANLADPDGSVCDEDPPQAIAVFSRQRGTCDDYCYEAEPVGEWVCLGAQDVHASCAEYDNSKLHAPHCSRNWGSKICACLDLGPSDKENEPQVREPPAAPALSSLVEVWEGVLPARLLELAMQRHHDMSFHAKATNRRDRSFGWLDVSAAPDLLDQPRDYVEAVAASVVAASPRLRALHEAGDIDVVEFFSHDRPQDRPQWFHFDTAEYARFDAPDARTVHNPSYSAIVYLSDEEEAHFGLFGSRHDCRATLRADSAATGETGNATNATGDGGSAATDDAKLAESDEMRVCTDAELSTPQPAHLSHAVLVRPRIGRVLVLDGAQLHGTLPGRRLRHTRRMLGLCFFRRRPTLPPASADGSPRGGRAIARVFALPDHLAEAGDGTDDAGTRTVAAAVGASGEARASQARAASGADVMGGGLRWAASRGAAPRLVANVSAGGYRIFSADEVAALHAASAASAPPPVPSGPPPAGPLSKGTRWRGSAPPSYSSGDTQIEIKIKDRRPLRRTLRLPPPTTLAAHCDVCAVELRPTLSLN